MIREALIVLLFCSGIFIYGMSFHNIDLSVNAKYGSIDTNGWGYSQDMITMYKNGMTGLGISMIFFISAFTISFMPLRLRMMKK